MKENPLDLNAKSIAIYESLFKNEATLNLMKYNHFISSTYQKVEEKVRKTFAEF